MLAENQLKENVKRLGLQREPMPVTPDAEYSRKLTEDSPNTVSSRLDVEVEEYSKEILLRN